MVLENALGLYGWDAEVYRHENPPEAPVDAAYPSDDVLDAFHGVQSYGSKSMRLQAHALDRAAVLVWEKLPRVTNYIVDWKRQDTDAWTTVHVPSVWVRLNGLVNGDAYESRVRDADETDAWSRTVTFTPTVPTPEPPDRNIDAALAVPSGHTIEATYGQFRVQWDARMFPTVRLRHKPLVSDTWQESDQIADGTGYRDLPNIDRGHTYEVQIRTEDGTAYSAWSDSVIEVADTKIRVLLGEEAISGLRTSEYVSLTDKLEDDITLFTIDAELEPDDRLDVQTPEGETLTLQILREPAMIGQSRLAFSYIATAV